MMDREIKNNTMEITARAHEIDLKVLLILGRVSFTRNKIHIRPAIIEIMPGNTRNSYCTIG
ncbi:MAG: hypothetical protein OIN88_14745 [Candidatus Methanoperedens sp.]|nr:hypothetical protein [Candidatus Methanoperedens sp.]